MTDIDPAAVMAEHEGHGFSGCYRRATTLFLGELPHCKPYRLAEALAASEAKVARVGHELDALLSRYTVGPGNVFRVLDLWQTDLRAALSDQPEQAS